MSSGEIEEILKKLSEEERRKVKRLIENHKATISRLESSLRASGQLLNIIVTNLQSIQTSLNTITRELVRAGVLRPRVEEVREAGG